ncbi:MAG: PEP-CTERM sorting domain-containing protein [Phycisphaerales bacterium]|nr:PEP-CTERM sorting domain-containing protein [Phycisphaerales bacterium]
MKVKALAMAGAAMFIAAGATADFTGAHIELVDDADGMDTWRVFIDFDSPTDVLLAVGGIPDLADLVFTSDTDLINDGGPFSGLKTEDFPATGFTGARDSWVSIGDNLGFPNPTDYSPGFAGSDGVTNIIKGTSFSEGNGGWFNNAPGSPVSGESILVAQFTTASGGVWSLSGLANWQTGAPEGFTSSFFEVAVPAPGALALLGLAGLAGARRRRA